MAPANSSQAVRLPRLWALDVLRGACALIVFLTHWHLWANFAPRGVAQQFVRELGAQCYRAFVEFTWPSGGHHPAVICFFVLSGFCIHYPSAARARASAPDPAWPDYFRRRFWRIMPAYWAASLLGIGFVFAFHHHHVDSLLLELHASSSTEDTVVRFSGLAGLYPREIFAGNYLLNTVSVEIVMYALYPLFHFWAARRRWVALGIAFVAMQGAAVLLLQVVTPYWIFNSVLMLGLFWYVGALTAHFFVDRSLTLHGGWLLGSWAAYLGLKFVPHFDGLTLVRQAAWSVVCAIGILWALRREQSDPAARGHRFVRLMRYVGSVSYSLYATHTPAIMLATWALLAFTSTHDYFVQLAAVGAASLAATLLSYYGVERMFYRPRA